MQDLYEVLGSYDSIEEKREKLDEANEIFDESIRLSRYENAYKAFIKDELGLYSVIKESILNYSRKSAGKNFYLVFPNKHYSYKDGTYLKIKFIRDFLDKYGFEVDVFFDKPVKNSYYYIDNIGTIEDVKRLLNCFYSELQQIDYYNMSKEELWERHQKFCEENKKYLEEKKGR